MNSIKILLELKEGLIENAENPSKQTQKAVMNLILELCQKKTRLKISAQMQMICALCENFINPDKPESFYALGCKCCTTWHKECLQEKAKKISKGFLQTLNSTEKKKIRCKNCKKHIKHSDFESSIFGEVEYNKVVKQHDLEAIEKLKKNEPLFIPEGNKIHEVICTTCQKSIPFRKIEKYVVTLDCNHKFCKKCIKESFELQFEENVQDIGCPNCKRTVSRTIIEHCGGSDKNYDRKFMIYEVAKAEVPLVKCVGCGFTFGDLEEAPQNETPRCVKCKIEKAKENLSKCSN